MLEINGNTIKDSIIQIINSNYPDTPIYEELVNEGLQYPYFFVMVDDVTSKKLMRENYLQTFIISVLYQYKELPETSFTEFNEIGYKLTDILELIELPNKDKLRGYNINYYVDEKKLEFYINYDIKVARPKIDKPKQLHHILDMYTK